jgi:hypothetical protein
VDRRELLWRERQKVVRSSALVRLAALVVAVGLACLVLFQLALIAGAPLGRAAWGGTQIRLPTSLRIASVGSILIYGLGALVVLRWAGFRIGWIPPMFAHWGTWALAVILTLSALINFLSQSSWERFIMGPAALLLAALSVFIAHWGTTHTVSSSAEPEDRVSLPD